MWCNAFHRHVTVSLLICLHTKFSGDVIVVQCSQLNEIVASNSQLAPCETFGIGSFSFSFDVDPLWLHHISDRFRRVVHLSIDAISFRASCMIYRFFQITNDLNRSLDIVGRSNCQEPLIGNAFLYLSISNSWSTITFKEKFLSFRNSILINTGRHFQSTVLGSLISQQCLNFYSDHRLFGKIDISYTKLWNVLHQ